ncbi:hypothetical protein EW146_g2926 [Bondarzewia mesenterica]|uniref:Uncharacterized protein n=1 Tax=Bondarzewia mesenterica TaxID=1095465 RepID=A0A4S4M0Z4_9AGAM|nr:hypothetical protein EW146_g2926 [Bondarzewia mesenterica]
MGSVCLSLVPVLRCIALSKLETALLLIPPALEVVFSVGLVFAGWGAGRKRFFLAAEGPIYFLLCLLDFLPHIIPGIADSLSAFKVFDIVVATISFLPLLCYTLFLYLFKRSEFFPNFPRRFRIIAKYFALVTIPVIIVTHEIGSFIGNTYRLVQFSGSSGPEPAVGSNNQSAEFARTFFNSFALALMTLYQALTFSIVFIRLSKAFLGQRQIETSSGTSKRSYLFRGVGWIAAGVKLGAVESVIGFAQGNFGIFFTRRMLRMLGRACLIIGVVRGPDTLENFQILDTELRGIDKHQSTRFITISGPHILTAGDNETRRRHSRFMLPSTFQQPAVSSLQPVATFTSLNVKQPLTTYTPSNQDGLRSHANDTPIMPMAPPLARQRPRPNPLTLVPEGQRVAVYQGQGLAPTLVLRLSNNTLPSPSTMMANTGIGASSMRSSIDTKVSPMVKSIASAPLLTRSLSRGRTSLSHTDSVLRTYHTSAGDSFRDREQPPRYLRHNAYVGRDRVMSASSLASDSLDVVQDLSSRFSSIPPRVTGKSPLSMYSAASEPAEKHDVSGALNRARSSKSTVSRGGSARRKPPPAVRTSMLPPGEVLPDNLQSVQTADKGRRDRQYDGLAAAGYPLSPPYTPAPPTAIESAVFSDEDLSMYDSQDYSERDNRRSSTLQTRPESMHSGQWMASSGSAAPTWTPDVEAYRAGPVRRAGNASTDRSVLAASESTDMLEISWLVNPEIGNEVDVSRPALGRIKTVGARAATAHPNSHAHALHARQRRAAHRGIPHGCD